MSYSHKLQTTLKYVLGPGGDTIITRECSGGDIRRIPVKYRRCQHLYGLKNRRKCITQIWHSNRGVICNVWILCVGRDGGCTLVGGGPMIALREAGRGKTGNRESSTLYWITLRSWYETMHVFEYFARANTRRDPTWQSYSQTLEYDADTLEHDAHTA